MAAATVAAAMFVGSVASLSAQATGGGGNQPADPPIVVYRKTLMNSNTQHMGALRALLSGQLNLPLDILHHTAALEASGKMFANIFPEESTHANSRALEEIWTNKDDFAQKVQAFTRATQNLNAVAQRGFNDQTMAALTAVQQTCGGCHTPYRRPAQPAAAR